MLRVLKNRVLRKITGPKSKEIKDNYTELHYQELPDFDSSTNIIWVMESRNTLSGACSMLWWKCEMHTMKQEGKRTLGRTRQREEHRTTLGQDRGK